MKERSWSRWFFWLVNSCGRLLGLDDNLVSCGCFLSKESSPEEEEGYDGIESKDSERPSRCTTVKTNKITRNHTVKTMNVFRPIFASSVCSGK